MCFRLPPIPVTTARLETYNVYPDIGAQGLEMECVGTDGVGTGTTDQKSRVRQERKKEKHQRIRSGYIRGSRSPKKQRLFKEEDCDFGGAVVSPSQRGEFLESRFEAPPAKRLIFEGALVRSLPRKNEENCEVCGIRIWSQRTLPTRWGITEKPEMMQRQSMLITNLSPTVAQVTGKLSKMNHG
ncbi:hypothetical protein TNCV_5133471 [Trichonephila clavipes]|nr:hypothetical protein TNCV_5133471 [Trichonephila clavipes]